MNNKVRPLKFEIILEGGRLEDENVSKEESENDKTRKMCWFEQ